MSKSNVTVNGERFNALPIDSHTAVVLADTLAGLPEFATATIWVVTVPETVAV